MPNNNKISFPLFLLEVPLFGHFCSHLSALHFLHYVAFRNVLVAYGMCLHTYGLPRLYLIMCLARWFLRIRWCINNLVGLFSSIK